MDTSGTFTYDSSFPTARDRMRHALGDTDATSPLRWDESYEAMLDYWGDEATATAKMARSLANQFGRQPSSVSVPGGPSVSFSDRVRSWLDTASSIEKVVGVTGAKSDGGQRLSRGSMDGDAITSEYRRGWDMPDGGWGW